MKSAWFLNFGGQAKCNLDLVVNSWPSLVVFGVVIPLWVEKHALSDEMESAFFFWNLIVAYHLFGCGKIDGVCSSSTDLQIITIFRYAWRDEQNFSRQYLWYHLKKKRQLKTVHSTNADWSWQISPSLCWKFRKWFLLYFNFLILTYSGQFTWQGHRKLQWAMSKDELLLWNSPLEAAEPSRNYARVPGYKKKGQEKDKKRKEKSTT